MKKILFLIMISISLSGGKAFALLNESTAISALKPFMYGESVDKRIFAFHSPIYPQTGSAPMYRAFGNVDANNPSNPSTLGIKRIRLWIKVYQITLNASGTREVTFKFGYTKLCENIAPYPKTANCSYTLPLLPGTSEALPDDAYVWYQASMRLSDDTLVRDRKITHTAKLSDAVKASYNDAYPIYRRGIQSEKFNILFVAATDYMNEAAYLADVSDFVINGLFAGDHVRKIRRFFNIYLNDFSHKVNISSAIEGGCTNGTVMNKEPDNWDDLSGMDIRVYAHATDFRDCGQLCFGQGCILSSDAANSTAHEMLHSLIGEGDEYPDSGGQVQGAHANIYVSFEDCEDHAKAFHPTKYAASPGCRGLGTKSDGTDSPFFHWCPENDLMDDGSGKLETEEWYQFYDQIDGHNLSAFSVLAQVSKTTTTEKSTTDTTSTTSTRDPTISEDAEEVTLNSEASIKAAIEEERWEKSQKTLSLRLRFIGPEVLLERFKVINGVAAPRIFYPKLEKDYLVSLFDNQGNLVQEFWTQDPRRIIIEQEAAGDAVSPPIQEILFNLRIAWQSNMARFKIQDKEGKTLLEAPVSEAAPSKTETETKTAPETESPTPSR